MSTDPPSGNPGSNEELSMLKSGEPADSPRYGSNHESESQSGSFTDPLWTVEDVAAYLKLQPETIRSMARRGELPALKIGKVWRFQKHIIHEMLIKLY